MDSRLTSLYRISWLLNSSHGLPAVLEGILDEAVRLTQADRGFIINVKGNELEFAAARNQEGETIIGHRSGVSLKSIQKAVSTGQCLLAHDAQSPAEKMTTLKLLGLRALLCAPVLNSAGEPLGVIYLDSSELSRFEEADQDLATALAHLVAVGLRR